MADTEDKKQAKPVEKPSPERKGPSGPPSTTNPRATVERHAHKMGLPPEKLAGIMRYANWKKESVVGADEFFRVAKEWLNHPVGTDKPRKEVSKL